MLFLELPSELIERALIELHPVEVVSLRQESPLSTCSNYLLKDHDIDLSHSTYHYRWFD